MGVHQVARLHVAVGVVMALLGGIDLVIGLGSRMAIRGWVRLRLRLGLRCWPCNWVLLLVLVLDSVSLLLLWMLSLLGLVRLLVD